MDFRLNKQGYITPAIIFIIVLSVLAFRRYDAFVNPQLWAEDGNVFLQQYYDLGLKSLVTPYAGYLNSAERLIVFFFGSLDFNLLYIPALYCATSVLIVYLIAIRLWQSARHMGLNNRVAYAVFFLFVPIMSDVFMNITNLNGILSLYLINRLFAREHEVKGTAKLIADSLIVFIISLSGPASILLCPVVGLMLIRERKTLNFQRILPMAIIMVCGVVQLILVKFVDTGFYRGTNDVTEQFHLLKFFTNNAGDLFYMQDHILPEMSAATELVVFTLEFLVLAGLFVYCYLKIENKNKYIILMAAGLYTASVIMAYWPHESYLYAMRNASRYFLVPYTCIGWLFLLSLDKKIKLPHLAIYLLFFLMHRPHMQFKLIDKHWSWEIMEYRQGKREMIDINPDGWQFRLPPDAQK